VRVYDNEVRHVVSAWVGMDGEIEGVDPEERWMAVSGEMGHYVDEEDEELCKDVDLPDWS
jgi:hypothetical protein